MAKFSNAKVGEGVFSSVNGCGKIVGICSERAHPIEVKFDNGIKDSYTFDGTQFDDDKYPSLFWNEFHIPTDEEDRKHFDLVDFLKENLEPKEFKFEEWNEYIVNIDEVWVGRATTCIEIPTIYFKSVRDSVLDTLTTEKVTMKQLKQAYKELGWEL